jgi:hypothetical protein
MAETGNPIARIALEKLQKVIGKNSDLKTVAAKSRGQNIEEPADIQTYMYAPCTSVDVERFFSVLHAFILDRPHILEETINKLMFIKYNSDL